MTIMQEPLFTGLTLLRPPGRHLAERLQAVVAAGLPLDAGQLARIISRDAITAATILKRANNAYYGLRETIGSLTHAIEVLEPEHVAHMIIGTSQASDDTPLLKSMLHTARTTAHAAHNMANDSDAADNPPPGMAFTAGLMHNFGHIILAMSFPSTAPALFNASQSTVLFDPGDWKTPQQLQFGMDAAEAGEFAARRLNLPSELVAVMASGGLPLADENVQSASSLLLLADVAAARTAGSRNTAAEEELCHRGYTCTTLAAADRKPLSRSHYAASITLKPQYGHGH